MNVGSDHNLVYFAMRKDHNIIVRVLFEYQISAERVMVDV